MGRLLAKRYRTSSMAYLADHTYVECGAGKAWGCWGGKTGGTLLSSGTGSTERAELIAAFDEKAGITRYLIDGVCHQAANRILAPAGLLVSGAHGYRLSQAIFGTYGRSSFKMHVGITGDLAECTAKASILAQKRAEPEELLVSGMSERDHALVRSNKAYQGHLPKPNTNHLESLNFNVHRFIQDVNILMNDELKHSSLEGLETAKRFMELHLYEMDVAMEAGYIDAAQFVGEFDRLTDVFQDAAANALNKREYKELFRADRDKRIRLTDPQAVDEAFGPGTFQLAKSAPPM